MYKNNRDAREQNIAGLAPLLGADTLEMQALARSLHKLHEARSKGKLTSRQCHREERATERADKLAGRHRLCIYVQRHPNGWPLYVYNPNDPRLREGPLVIEGRLPTVGVAVCPL